MLDSNKMPDIFKTSAQRERATLAKQIDELTVLAQDMPPDVAGLAQWRARRDFATAAIRDTLKRVIPPDSALYAVFSPVIAPPVQTPQFDGQPRMSIDPYEVELYRSALNSITWSSAAVGQGPAVPLVSSYTLAQQMLPELVYKHWTFKVIIALLVVAVGFGIKGVVAFNGMTVDLGAEVRAKAAKLSDEVRASANALQTDVEKQRQSVGATLDLNRTQADAVSSQIKDLQTRASDAYGRIAQIQDDANRTLANLTREAANKISDEGPKRLTDVHKALDVAQNDAVALINKAGDTRVKEIMSTDVGGKFKDKVKEFTASQEKANTDLYALEKRQDAFDARLKISARAAGILEKPTSFIDRMAVYLDEAVWYVWLLGICMFILLAMNMLLVLILWVRS